MGWKNYQPKPNQPESQNKILIQSDHKLVNTNLRCWVELVLSSRWIRCTLTSYEMWEF